MQSPGVVSPPPEAGHWTAWTGEGSGAEKNRGREDENQPVPSDSTARGSAPRRREGHWVQKPLVQGDGEAFPVAPRCAVGEAWGAEAS